MEDPNLSTRQPNGPAGGSQAYGSSQGDQGPRAAAAGAVDTVKEAAQDASGQASSLVGQVKDRALAAASDGKEGIADRIDELAQTVHKSGEQFSGQQDWIASAIERGAAELSSLAGSLRDNDLGSLVGQVRSLARQQPALFIGACLAGGFALARVAKIVVADVSRDDLPTLPEISHGER